MKSKQELRLEYKTKRCQLSVETETTLNERLLSQFTKLDLSEVEFLHIFIPIGKYHEPNTYLIINYIQESFPQIKIVVSRSNFEDYSMQHFILDEHTLFETNNWGIPEPVSGIKVNSSLIDMIIVPLLIFDLLGYRVGYGKGFYDRFFSSCKVDVQRVGLSFFHPIDVIADKNEYDVQLTQAITPDHIYHFFDK
ncbi:5-formyltetrahydrofolate cyclo-ligase [Sphingobacterium multivorum]|uniref:5-formyltetrahydrofolate cyclo-ligase n=1 Tax=Sphingobacterium multivorum TaxID=28454 RepID=A0A654BFP6_SPHMU|nr:5-formyltetrahydrofolate cyclo-ligase [Sphingobacterium multivorum]HAE66485.1 5-formyltetrahydrofolate cyclo-ligase [Sphingobacterium sp.]QQT43800.1 5-formyltetrahydrofolate cyclo-ligase [Sphingobacterium multivorum]QQT63447.1 5-formyltetrahydrofolate cyclo-ligase [Sphingobacterium multivorum]SUJ06118.1 5-formyltetrahydrofolate cyclo-ligase family protein [Sphingobacterium multivorum]VXC79250.1 5-formyltetrahydrofolate cyclo-ligase [Sphingobacterium multivorum]